MEMWDGKEGHMKCMYRFKNSRTCDADAEEGQEVCNYHLLVKYNMQIKGARGQAAGPRRDTMRFTRKELEHLHTLFPGLNLRSRKDIAERVRKQIKFQTGTKQVCWNCRDIIRKCTG